MIVSPEKLRETSFWGNQRRLYFSSPLLFSHSFVYCRYLVPDQTDVVKLVDFGCACPLNGNIQCSFPFLSEAYLTIWAASDYAEDQKNGKITIFRGTEVYASPEQVALILNSKMKSPSSSASATVANSPSLSQKGYAKKADSWGVGVVMFFILGGYPPFMSKVKHI
jgi:serine/threonine protein kinase